MSRLIPSYIEQALRIELLERAVIASEQDYERMKAAAQEAYRAMVAMELSDGSKREWDAAIDGLKAALAEPAIKESLIAQRQWVGLTVHDQNDCLVSANPCECLADAESHQLMDDVEAKLREKNT